MILRKHMMSDDFPIANKVVDGKVVGFSLGLYYPNYRGMYLAYIQDILVTVDGKEYNGEAITVTLASGSYTIDEMQSCGFARWNYGEVGEVFVAAPGGLAPGKHHIEAGIMARGYLGTHGAYSGGCRDIVIE